MPKNVNDHKSPKTPQANSPVDGQPVAEPADLAAAAYTAKITELTNDLQRTRADFENFRKQVDAQKLQAMDTAKYATVMKFLPLIDDLDRAMQAYTKELAPLQKSFEKTLQSLNLTRIDSAVGTEFNPDFHEAVSVEDGDGEHEVIAETLRPGYLYDGAVIRAAMVKVKHA